MEPSPSPHQPKTGEIDIIELIRIIWHGRWLIVKVTVGFMALGILIAFTTQEQFKVEARLLPEIKDTRGGASALLRQFGGMGGLNIPMGEGADAIRPELYPDVLNSTPFFVALMEHTIMVNINGNPEEITVLSYVDDHMSSSFWGGVMKYTLQLPWTIWGWVRGANHEGETLTEESYLFQMTKNQYEAVKILRQNITAGADQRSGVIKVSAVFPDRRIAAHIAQFAVEYLTSYISEYRIQKAQKDLHFVQTRHDEKMHEFHQAQITLARFLDSNRNIISAAAQTEEQRLQDQYNLAFNVYNGLAQQLEQARIKVQEETPVITILEPVSIPVERIKPQRPLIVFSYAFLGCFLGVFYILGIHFWNKYIQQFKPE